MKRDITFADEMYFDFENLSAVFYDQPLILLPLFAILLHSK